MNELEAALRRDLSAILVEQRMPSGRPLTDAEWWQALEVLEAVGDMPAVWPARRAGGCPAQRGYPIMRPYVERTE